MRLFRIGLGYLFAFFFGHPWAQLNAPVKFCRYVGCGKILSPMDSDIGYEFCWDHRFWDYKAKNVSSDKQMHKFLYKE